MINLPNVTVVLVDCKNYGPAMMAIKKTLQQIKPARTIFFTDITLSDPDFEVKNIKRLFSSKEYSHFIIKELGKYHFDTSHVLVIQHDGYVLDGEAWTDEFLNYSYVGAPWLYVDGRNVGNGGFSLRSVKLLEVLVEDSHIQGFHPEDDCVCRLYHDYLETNYDIKFCPEPLAHRFSYELHTPGQSTFGFHGNFHPPYKPYVVIKRTGAMGDVVQVEPILEFFHESGFNVVLDSPFYEFYHFHRFPVINYEKFDKKVIPHRIIDLNSSYESRPKQLHLKSYFETCGITTDELRNPILNYDVTPETKLFPKYVVIHIDKRETTHRNIYGVEWERVRLHLNSHGFTVIQIGKNEHEEAGLEFNTVNFQLMMWLIGGCDLFLGCDSGPANLAVALGRKCIISFGSVDPKIIYHDLTNITVLQSKCPANIDGCWSKAPGFRGADCIIDVKQPPCCSFTTKTVLDAINKVL